jgi:hypothetical protein
MHRVYGGQPYPLYDTSHDFQQNYTGTGYGEYSYTQKSYSEFGYDGEHPSIQHTPTDTRHGGETSDGLLTCQDSVVGEVPSPRRAADFGFDSDSSDENREVEDVEYAEDVSPFQTNQV